jgi:aspartate-semialdehyde dehydrogenase
MAFSFKAYMLQVLSARNFPYSSLKMLASSRSAGKTYDFEGETYTVEELTEVSFKDCDIALFSAGGGISKKFGPIAADAGCTVVDNSSAFRMAEGVPLVIPEVNADAMAGMKVRLFCCLVLWLLNKNYYLFIQMIQVLLQD